MLRWLQRDGFKIALLVMFAPTVTASVEQSRIGEVGRCQTLLEAG